MNKPIKIDKNVPLPIRGHNRYPFEHMNVGDSFYTDKVGSIRTSASLQNTRGVKRFTVSKEGAGMRVWRTA